MNFSEKLERLISKSGEDITKLAPKIGISPAALSSYKNGSREPGMNALHKIAKHFEVTADYLIDPSIKNSDPKNQTIGKELGLSDDSIELLESLTQQEINSSDSNGFIAVRTIDFLIKNEFRYSFFTHIGEFLWSEYKAIIRNGDITNLERLSPGEYFVAIDERTGEVRPFRAKALNQMHLIAAQEKLMMMKKDWQENEGENEIKSPHDGTAKSFMSFRV